MFTLNSVKSGFTKQLASGHLDLSEHYGSEKEVHRAIEDAGGAMCRVRCDIIYLHINQLCC